MGCTMDTLNSSVVKLLAWYLTVVSIFGSIAQVWIFVASVSITQTTNTFEFDDYQNQTGDNTTLKSYFAWDTILWTSTTLFQRTFPVSSPMFATNSSTSSLPVALAASDNFWCFAILGTLLPTFSLLKGAYTRNPSNCQYWYYTQVAVLLLSVFKLFVVTIVGMWDMHTNEALIGILFGIAQLWLVQRFMENIQLQRGIDKQKKYQYHMYAMNDLDTLDCHKTCSRMPCENIHFNLISNNV